MTETSDPRMWGAGQKRRKAGWVLAAAGLFFAIQQLLTVFAIADQDLGGGFLLRLIALVAGGWWFFSSWRAFTDAGNDLAIIGDAPIPRRWRDRPKTDWLPALALVAMPALIGVAFLVQWAQGPAAYGTLSDETSAVCGNSVGRLGVLETDDSVLAVSGVARFHEGSIMTTRATPEPDFDQFYDTVISGRTSRITHVLCLRDNFTSGVPRLCEPHTAELWSGSEKLSSTTVRPFSGCAASSEITDVRFGLSEGAPPALVNVLSDIYPLADV